MKECFLLARFTAEQKLWSIGRLSEVASLILWTAENIGHVVSSSQERFDYVNVDKQLVLIKSSLGLKKSVNFYILRE